MNPPPLSRGHAKKSPPAQGGYKPIKIIQVGPCAKISITRSWSFFIHQSPFWGFHLPFAGFEVPFSGFQVRISSFQCVFFDPSIPGVSFSMSCSWILVSFYIDFSITVQSFLRHWFYMNSLDFPIASYFATPSATRILLHEYNGLRRFTLCRN